MIGKRFGQVKLWDDRAEFEVVGKGACGLRKINRGRGFAHMDVYFDALTAESQKNLFISFVEDHLHRHDVEVTEHIELICTKCRYQFAEGDIRERIARGEVDIGCPRCDLRTALASGVAKARHNDPTLANQTFAFRTQVEKTVESAARSAKKFFRRTDEQLQMTSPIRILHISDLHFSEHVDVTSLLRPLVVSIKDKNGGLGFERLDYLVISGDMGNRATPEEFDKAREFTSGIVGAFELTANRCIFVPGNHDLSWDAPVYSWVRSSRLTQNH